MVMGGSVDTMNSAVVGEGRRVRRYGAVVNMAGGWFENRVVES